MQPKLSVVIPVLNEAGQIAAKLGALQPLRADCELLLADGGSDDGSRIVAEVLVDKVLQAPCGRAKQMNVGAMAAQARVLLFLHADTRLPDEAVRRILRAVADGYQWGRFDVEFDDPRPVFKLIAFMMNWRSRLTGIATGDQALFVTRSAFQAVGGFPEIALMEDIAISRRLKKLGKPCCPRDKVITSARRWRKHGILNTILLMWRLRLAYFFGADPGELAVQYYRRP
ncbi:TIGR04283 family arsenosugar biosynthesis glycosyltransferase [Methylomonas sp. LL1]|uniref:TIGR04283 family arsenosugar biosynthesis glycosyltransferase n=1 Tax=Methylomonas sp. LL1 TaxID=2785785 RepID=UPI0018C3573F|nr:TIGR04283 family arsenosugar biosynthesis glycosyltransferase [Methylomonas sp. LL1]QPK61977.1 TIGR04283 family arsenosugar biosynthesis glycosyltransferase [Methylomonas sp. LL1]